MTPSDVLDQGRESFARHEWARAYAQLSEADQRSPLDPEDLDRLAVTAHLIGKADESADIWTRSYNESVRAGDAPQAARCAFWLAFHLVNKGEFAPGSGWVARAQRLLDEGRHDCVERGYLRYAVGMQSAIEGDWSTGHASFSQAAEIGNHFRDPDLVTLARQGEGRALIRLGQPTEGMALLDEVMVAVTTGEVSPIIAGDTYCSVIEACQETFDLRRSQVWTAALSHWAASQPDLIPYGGQCQVHRSEIMQLYGAWPDAMNEARRACERLSQPPGELAAGAAYYQQAELHRLRGELDSAEAAYRQASDWGREPQPGLALLRLVQGQVDAAVAAIRRVVDEARDGTSRPNVLAACVEIMLAVKDVGAARAAADELSQIATDIDAPVLRAMSAHATGAALRAEGDSRAALVVLREAWAAWRELGAPYQAAQVRVLVGLACRDLGDEDGGALELEAAQRVFQELGAAPALAQMEVSARTGPTRGAGGLTPREAEVLALVATGRTNRETASALVISEHTVARHMQNIFAKLGLSSRTAASAFAFEHDLV
jgi:ATP/maltotriose-dependent transcriptional regulator MalT